MLYRYLLTAVLAAAASAAPPASYEIDSAHSSAQFTVRHMLVSNVRGEFAKLSGVVLYDPADLSASSVETAIDAASISTRNAKRDDHLRSPDFLDAAKFPTLTFVSKRIYTDGKDVRIKGDLTIHGVTREVEFQLDGPVQQIKDPSGSTRIGASAKTHVSRKDFGLTWNKLLESGGAVVGDEVTVILDIEAVRKGQ
jgi:polyisoprenoid-binding protein YceI